MNNPFPSAMQLRAESAIDRILAAQQDDVATFCAILRTAQKAIAALQLPLGSPAHRYDLADITEALADWQTPVDPARLQERAEDLVAERLETA